MHRDDSDATPWEVGSALGCFQECIHTAWTAICDFRPSLPVCRDKNARRENVCIFLLGKMLALVSWLCLGNFECPRLHSQLWRDVLSMMPLVQ